MPVFNFRLRTLLRVRLAARDECRAQLAEAYRAEELLRSRQAELAGELAGLKESCRSASQGAVDVDRLIDAQRYELVVLAQQELLTQHAQTLAAEIDRRREALVTADREARILEKLRETQLREHRQAEVRVEAKLMDEVAARCEAGERA